MTAPQVDVRGTAGSPSLRPQKSPGPGLKGQISATVLHVCVCSTHMYVCFHMLLSAAAAGPEGQI